MPRHTHHGTPCVARMARDCASSWPTARECGIHQNAAAQASVGGAAWTPPGEVNKGVHVLSVGFVLVSLSVGCGAPVAAQEIRSVIEEIASLQADAVEILGVIRDETAQAVSEWPDDPQAQADADRAAERFAQAAEQYTALLEKMGEVLAADEWDRAFSVEALAGGDGRPIAS